VEIAVMVVGAESGTACSWTERKWLVITASPSRYQRSPSIILPLSLPPLIGVVHSTLNDAERAMLDGKRKFADLKSRSSIFAPEKLAQNPLR